MKTKIFCKPHYRLLIMVQLESWHNFIICHTQFLAAKFDTVNYWRLRLPEYHCIKYSRTDEKLQLVGIMFVTHSCGVFLGNTTEHIKVLLLKKHFIKQSNAHAYLPECQFTECNKLLAKVLYTIQILHLAFSGKESNTPKQRNALCITF